MRFRCLVIALALLAAPASDSWGQSKRPPPQTQPAQQQAAPDQRGTENSPVVVKVLPTQETAEKAKAEAKEHDEKRKFDADTLWLSKLTVGIIFLQLLIFGAQAYFLWGTLRATATAAEAAIDAAALASKHERAYMFTGPAQEGGVSINWQQSTVQVQFEIENSGRTVGILKKLRLGFTTEEPTNQRATYEGDGFRTFDFDMAIKAGTKHVYTGPLQSPLPPITTFVVGYINYIDIFKAPHFSRFCIRVDPDGSYRPIGPQAWNDWN